MSKRKSHYIPKKRRENAERWDLITARPACGNIDALLLTSHSDHPTCKPCASKAREEMERMRDDTWQDHKGRAPDGYPSKAPKGRFDDPWKEAVHDHAYQGGVVLSGDYPPDRAVELLCQRHFARGMASRPAADGEPPKATVEGGNWREALRIVGEDAALETRWIEGLSPAAAVKTIRERIREQEDFNGEAYGRGYDAACQQAPDLDTESMREAIEAEIATYRRYERAERARALCNLGLASTHIERTHALDTGFRAAHMTTVYGEIVHALEILLKNPALGGSDHG